MKMVDANAAAAGDGGDPSAAELQSGKPKEATTIAEGAEAAAQLAAGGKESDEARDSESDAEGDADERDKTASVAIPDEDKAFSTVVLSKTEARLHTDVENTEKDRESIPLAKELQLSKHTSPGGRRSTYSPGILEGQFVANGESRHLHELVSCVPFPGFFWLC